MVTRKGATGAVATYVTRADIETPSLPIDRSFAMDRLPWHLQIKIYRRVDTDARRALGVAPGTISVPPALRAALEGSLARRIYIRRLTMAPDGPWFAMVTLPIAGTGRKFHLFSR